MRTITTKDLKAMNLKWRQAGDEPHEYIKALDDSDNTVARFNSNAWPVHDWQLWDLTNLGEAMIKQASRIREAATRREANALRQKEWDVATGVYVAEFRDISSRLDKAIKRLVEIETTNDLKKYLEQEKRVKHLEEEFKRWVRPSNILFLFEQIDELERRL